MGQKLNIKKFKGGKNSDNDFADGNLSNHDEPNGDNNETISPNEPGIEQTKKLTEEGIDETINEVEEEEKEKISIQGLDQNKQKNQSVPARMSRMGNKRNSYHRRANSFLEMI